MKTTIYLAGEVEERWDEIKIKLYINGHNLSSFIHEKLVELADDNSVDITDPVTIKAIELMDRFHKRNANVRVSKRNSNIKVKK
jgi:hypothetical protein